MFNFIKLILHRLESIRSYVTYLKINVMWPRCATVSKDMCPSPSVLVFTDF